MTDPALLPPLATGEAGYDTVLSSMLGALTAQPRFVRLRPSDQADWIVALCAGWATLADVLSFYDERILNEAFLATAQQPDSQTNIYRSLGQGFAANAAATTVLSYQVSDRAAGVEAVARARRGGAGAPLPATPAQQSAPGTGGGAAAGSDAAAFFGVSRRTLASGALPVPSSSALTAPGTQTTVAAGSQVRAIPGPDGPAPVFVTLDALDGQPGASGLQPALRVAGALAPLEGSSTQVELDGVATGLQPGAPILIVAEAGSGAWVRSVTAVAADRQRNSTRVTWDQPLDPSAAGRPGVAVGAATVYSFASSSALAGSDAAPWSTLSPAAQAAAFGDRPAPMRGGVLRSSDGGMTWAAAAGFPTAPAALTAVLAVDDLLLVGAGRDGLYLSSGGARFAAVTLPTGRRPVTALGGTRSCLLLGTSDGHLLESFDDGRNWSEVAGGPPTKAAGGSVVMNSLPATAVHAVLNADAGLLAGTDSGIFRYTAAVLGHNPTPARWAPDPGAQEAIFALADSTTGTLAGGAQGVKVWTGGSATTAWAEAGLAHTRVYALATVTGADGSETVFAGTDAGVYRTPAANLSQWQLQNGTGTAALPADTAVTSITAQPGLVLAGTAEGLYRSTDAGQSWTRADTTNLFTLPAAAAPAGTTAPSELVVAFSAHGIELAPGTALSAVDSGFEVSATDGTAYKLARNGGDWIVQLAGHLMPVTALGQHSPSPPAAGRSATTSTTAAQTLYACVWPITPLAYEWPDFVVAGDAVELSARVRGAVPGTRAAIVQQTSTPASQAIDIISVEQDAVPRFGRAARVTRLTLAETLPAGQYPRRSTTVWVGASPLTRFTPPAPPVTVVGGSTLRLGVPLAAPLPAGRLAAVSGQPVTLTVAPLGGVVRVQGSAATFLGPAQADVLDLLLTQNGDLVLGTGEGPFLMAPAGTAPRLLADGWPGGAARALVTPAAGSVWAASGAGVRRLSLSGTMSWTSAGLDGLSIATLSSGAGRIVATTSGGGVFECLNPAEATPTWTALPALPIAATAAVVMGENTYAATASGPLSLNIGAGAWTPLGSAPPAGITTLALDSAQMLWAGYPNGVASLDAATGLWRPDDVASLESGVTALAVAADGSLVAAGSQGVFTRSSRGAWTRLPGDPGVTVNALTYGPDGSLWIAGSDALAFAPDTASAVTEARHTDLFAALNVSRSDLDTLDQGGLPSALADAFTDTGEKLDHTKLIVSGGVPAGAAWLVSNGSRLYVVARREGDGQTTVNGYRCDDALARAAGAPSTDAGLGIYPVTVDGAAATIRAMPSLVVELPAGTDAPQLAETATLGPPDPDHPTTVLHFEAPLGGLYDASTVKVNLNVVEAAHGVPVMLAIGSGDPTVANQTFQIPTPVAVLPDSSGGSPQSSLTITVDGVAWTATNIMLSAAPDDRVYVFSASADGSGVVRFGDGVHGARLPAGSGNVLASYLQGGGAAGAVAEGTLIQPLDRPQMVQSVHNPLPAIQPPAPSSDAALVGIRLLDRVVSLQDYELAADVQPGVLSARAQWLGGGAEVVVTIASSDPNTDAADLAPAVAAALNDQTTGDVRLRVLPAILVPIALDLEVVSPQDGVDVAVRGQLDRLPAFRPGDALLAAQVITAAVGVDGVLAARIRGWNRDGAPPSNATEQDVQPARRLDTGYPVLQAAEFAYIDGRLNRLRITVTSPEASE